MFLYQEQICYRLESVIDKEMNMYCRPKNNVIAEQYEILSLDDSREVGVGADKIQCFPCYQSSSFRIKLKCLHIYASFKLH